jgi:hypothetical protein
MKPETKRESPSFRKGGRRPNLLVIPILVILVVGILFFLTMHQKEGINSAQLERNGQSGIWGKITHALFDNLDQLKHALNEKRYGKASTGSSQQGSEKAGDPSPAMQGSQPSADRQPPETLAGNGQPGSTTTVTSVPSGTAEPIKQPEDKIKAFYAHLDTKPYLQEYHLEKPSQAHFTGLMQKLLDNRPVTTRETDDLLTVVKNTAHFYRVLGKDNITLLKNVLDQEKSSLEDMLADYYALAETPEGLQKSLSLRVPLNALYEYAGFFLNTMGGRLYLFRRDPVTRMTVTYYGILIVDKANRESNNKDGIQIKQTIDSLIAEIEGSGSQLRFKERYLDKLYELKEKYQ